MKSIKNKIFKIIQPADNSSILSKMFDLVIVTLILINTVTIIAATFSLSALKIRIFLIIEIVSVIIFSVEYILRLWTADLLYPEKKPFIARIKLFFSPMAIVDLLAILPFYIPFLLPIDLRILRLIRLLRLFRLFKMNRYTSGLSSIGNVLKKKSDQLVSSIFVVFLLMIISSVIMYYFENPVQPDVFSNAFSGLWWAISTFTTVGYGDIYPLTVAGKIFSAIIALLGIGLVAVPTGIISAGFMENIEDNNKQLTEDNIVKIREILEKYDSKNL